MAIFCKLALALYILKVSSVPVNSTISPGPFHISWMSVAPSAGFETMTSQTPYPSVLLFMPPYPGHLLLSPAPTSSSKPPVVTQTVVTTVAAPPRTVTVSATPSTANRTITSFTPSLSSPSASATFSKSVWSASAQITDLSSFNVTAFPCGQQNLVIVKGIPANASASTFAIAPEPTGSLPHWDNSTSVLQLLYPANSINPAQKPQGGAEFYATPIQVAGARSVTLDYSVFFPADFDWALAGKLPGLYGGHTGCSGGNDALTCFSTRLMWREGEWRALPRTFHCSFL